MRYVEARLDEYQREKAYRSYVTRSLQLIPQNAYITASFDELLNPQKAKESAKTGDEIVADVMAQAGLRFSE